MLGYWSLALSEAVTCQMATTQSTLADAARALYLPYARLDTNAGHVVFALLAIDVIYVLLQFLESHRSLQDLADWVYHDWLSSVALAIK
jgi:hypothetical protein